MSSQYSLFIRSYCCSAIFIILFKNNWSLPSLCFTLSLESAPFISSSTSFGYHFFHFRLTYFLTGHFFFWCTTLYIHNCFFSFSFWPVEKFSAQTPYRRKSVSIRHGGRRPRQCAGMLLSTLQTRELYIAWNNVFTYLASMWRNKTLPSYF